jgi:hypothetical protein
MAQATFKKPPMAALLTPAIIKLVQEMIMQQAKAEVLEEKKAAIGARILQEIPTFDQLDLDGQRDCGERILDWEYAWMTGDEQFAAICARMNLEMRAAGLKPADMADEMCPALVAKYDLTKARTKLVEATAPLFGQDPEVVIMDPNGAMKKWVDLIAELAIKARKVNAAGALLQLGLF